MEYKYVYKIVGKFTDDNLPKLISKISLKFSLMYLDDTLFLALKSWSAYPDSESLLTSTFRPVRDFYIENITSKNISKLSPVMQDWCMNHLTRLDAERYEAENQETLKQAWVAMDNMEMELKRMVDEQKAQDEKLNNLKDKLNNNNTNKEEIRKEVESNE